MKSLYKMLLLFAAAMLSLAVLSHADWHQIGQTQHVTPNTNVSQEFGKIGTPLFYLFDRNSVTQDPDVYYYQGQDWSTSPPTGTAISELLISVADTSNTVTPQKYVKLYNGTSWNAIGPAVNNGATVTMDVKDILSHDGNRYVACVETEGEPSTVDDLFVKKWNGTDWEQLGAAVNYTSDTVAAKLQTTSDGTLYVAWVELKYNNGYTGKAYVHVSHYNGTQWVADGTNINGDELEDVLYNMDFAISSQDQLYVLYEESLHTIRLKTKQAGIWSNVGGALLDDSQVYGTQIDMTVTETGTPFVSWMEVYDSGQPSEHYIWNVRYWAQSAWTSIRSRVDQQTPVIKLLSGVNDQIYSLYSYDGDVTTELYNVVEPPSPTVTLGETPQVVDVRIHAYPNPASGEVVFTWQETNATRAVVTLFNIAGERVARLAADHPDQRLTWNAGNLAPGIYLYQIEITVDEKVKKLPRQKIAIVR